MSLREVGLLVYSQGFAISQEEYIVRELAFCDLRVVQIPVTPWPNVRPANRGRQDQRGSSDQDSAWITF